MACWTHRIARALAVLALLTAAGARAEQWHGTVIAIADGDTLTLLDASHRARRIRLDGIDAPERGQPYGQRARQSLAGLAHGRAAIAECDKNDRYGRAVCRVTVEGADLGLEQLRRGLAWHYVHYAHEQSPPQRAAYSNAEAEARTARSGLWGMREPTAPWDYRRSARGG